MTVLELIDELSKQEPHRKVALAGVVLDDKPYPRGFHVMVWDDIKHIVIRKGKTETSLEPEDLVILY